MLLELYIENFAIIDKINISFSQGFNVFTGETGAGKSIIIDAMNTVLGERATKEYIRTGMDKAIIEALFQIKNHEHISEILSQYGIEMEPDNTLLITREIYLSGKSICRINGRTVTLSMLKNLTSKLVDIHGQHQHQSLLDCENHINFIDLLGGKNIKSIKKQINEWYSKLQNLKNKLNQFAFDDKERERKLDLLKFQFDEINDANLQRNEEEDLINEYNKYSNIESIFNTIGNILETLNSSDYNNTSLIDQLNFISSNLHKISRHDNKLLNYCNILDTIIYQLQDLVIELRNYEETISYEPEKLKNLEDRIDTINKLKRKYGNTIDEILKYKEEIATEIDFLINSEAEINNIKNEIREIEEKLLELSDILTSERKKVGSIIENNITKELTQLNMANVKFKIKYDKLNYFTRNGMDKVEFLISTNPGEPLKPLSKIASGGEISRVMLAFKSILAEVDNIPCLIFDEIDTGISGRTAQIVGEKIANISRSHQILCVTHLPQIAAMASNHLLIKKEVLENKTYTVIEKLNFEQRVEELARLLGGINLTDTTKKHAKEMLEMSKQFLNIP